MKDLMNAKIFLEILFTLPKSEGTRKAWITALNRKEDIPVQSQHTGSARFNICHTVILTEVDLRMTFFVKTVKLLLAVSMEL